MTVAGENCVFPFIYKNKTYDSCTLDDSEDGSPWCSTLVNSQGIHVEGEGWEGQCGFKQGQSEGDGDKETCSIPGNSKLHSLGRMIITLSNHGTACYIKPIMI